MRINTVYGRATAALLAPYEVHEGMKRFSCSCKLSFLEEQEEVSRFVDLFSLMFGVVFFFFFWRGILKLPFC